MSDARLLMEQKRPPVKQEQAAWQRQHAAINPAERSQNVAAGAQREEPTEPQRDFSQVKTQSSGCAYPPQRCPFGGACETCTTHLQAKLAVNQPGDVYEQEADRVAEQVMGTATSATGEQDGLSSTAPPPNLQFRRLHSDDQGNVQRQETESADGMMEEEEEQEEEREDEPDVQMKSQAGQPAEVKPNIAAKVQGSVGDGQPLPDSTRSFYEERFQRSFDGVRIHSGGDAWDLNRQMGSYAFTYRNHIWLGSGQKVEPSRLLAHELVHVVQQVAPPMLQGWQNGQGIIQKADRPVVQRFIPYWEPYEENGTTTHNKILPQISRGASIFVEAPVPNADRLSAAIGKRGIADMYDASTTVGLYYVSNQAPVPLPAPSRLRKDGARYQHGSLAAPKVNALHRISRVDAAPTSIVIGELKPSHGTIEAAVGKNQIENYLEGFAYAAREVNEQAGPSGQRWNIATRDLFSVAQLRAFIPSIYRYPASAQTPVRLALKINSRAIRINQRVSGRLILEPHEKGILNYVWVPDTVPNFTLPARIRALGEQVRERIMNPLLRPPVRASVHDSFNLGQWRTDRSQIRREFRALRGSADLRDTTSAARVAEANEAIRTIAHLNVPAPSMQTVEARRTLDRLEFWTSVQAGVFGTFRRMFGRTFVKVADAYERMRTRFGNTLRRMRAPGGGGLPGAAIKAIITVLKMAGVLIVNRTADVLGESLVQGLTNKLQALIPEDNIAQLRNQVQVVDQMKDQLSQQAIATANQIVESIFPNFQENINTIQNVTQIVGNITRFVNLVKWGARAIACLAPPAIGCLWALAQAALEQLAAVVVQSCWFQEKIAPYLVALEYVRGLPRTLAQLIIRGIRALLPQGLHDVFADVSAQELRASDRIECDNTEGTGRQITDDQQALLDMQEQLGDERFEAFLAMLRSSGAPAGAPIRRADVERLSQFIRESGLTAEEMRRIGAGARGRPVEVEEFIEQARRSRERIRTEPVMPEYGVEAPLPTPEPSPETPAPQPTPEPSPDTPVPQTEPAPSEEQAGSAEGQVQEGITEESTTEPAGEATQEQGRPRTTVQEANSRPSSGSGGSRVSGWRTQTTVARGQLAVGQQVLLNIRMTKPGAVRVMRNLEVRVVEIAPSETDPQVQEYFMEVTRSQKFTFLGGEEYYTWEGAEFIYRRAAPSRRGQ